MISKTPRLLTIRVSEWEFLLLPLLFLGIGHPLKTWFPCPDVLRGRIFHPTTAGSNSVGSSRLLDLVEGPLNSRGSPETNPSSDSFFPEMPAHQECRLTPVSRQHISSPRKRSSTRNPRRKEISSRNVSRSSPSCKPSGFQCRLPAPDIRSAATRSFPRSSPPCSLQRAQIAAVDGGPSAHLGP